MEVQFTTSVEDFFAYKLPTQKRSRFYRPVMIFFFWVFPVGVLLYVASIMRSDPIRAIYYTAIIIASRSVFRSTRDIDPVTQQTLIKKTFWPEAVTGKINLVLADDTLVIRTEFNRSTVKWQDLKNVDVIHDGLYVFVPGLGDILIRRHGFERTQDFEKVKAFALDKLGIQPASGTMNNLEDNPEWSALMMAIRDNLADDLPRLAAADWLEEQGKQARAEFIRVECALAKLQGATDSPHEDGLHLSALLRRREELFQSGIGQDLLPQRINWHFTWSRGFVSAVQCRLADWLEWQCDVCEGTGLAYEFNIFSGSHFSPCQACSASRGTATQGPRIARLSALEWVTLDDRKPLEHTEDAGYPSTIDLGTSSLWHTSEDPEVHELYADFPYFLPPEIFNHLDSTHGTTILQESAYSMVMAFTTEDAAMAALSHACIRWALAQPVSR